MDNPVLMGIVFTIIQLVIAGASAYVILKRAPYQNILDGATASEIYQRMANEAAKREAELEKRIEQLEDILDNRQYKVIFDVTLGETPTVKSASIEALKAKGR